MRRRQQGNVSMVNIHIHQFQPGSAVVDAAALEQFQQQWATYQKLVDADELSHKAVGTARQLFEDPTGFYRVFRYDL